MTPPPGPRGLPLLGNLLEFSRDVLGAYDDWARRYGDVVALRLGAWPAVLLNHPDHAEQVLVRNPHNFIKFPFFFRHVRAIFGQGLLTSEGAFWLRQRRLAAPAFHPQRLAGYGESMVRSTERTIEMWRPDEARDVHADAMALTLRIAAKTLFDTEVESNVAEIGQAFGAITEEIAVRIRRPFRIPDAIPTPGNLRYRRGVSRIDRLVTAIIRERRAQGEDRGDLLSHADAGARRGRPADERAAVARRGDDAAARRPRDDGACALLDVVPAGASRRGGCRGSRRKCGDVLGGRAPTVGDLPRLALHRAGGDGGHAPLSARVGLRPRGDRGLRDRRLCHPGRHDDHHQPLGAAPRSALVRAIRLEFRPERWSGDFARQLPRFAYIPFGGGPRICIGNRFAMMEAILILATWLSASSCEWRATGPVVPLPSITLRPKGGVWVKPVRRAQ